VPDCYGGLVDRNGGGGLRLNDSRHDDDVEGSSLYLHVHVAVVLLFLVKLKYFLFVFLLILVGGVIVRAPNHYYTT